MTDAELERVAARHGDRMAWLVSDDNPNARSREEHRRWVREQAAAPWPPPDPPTLLGKAASLTKAAVAFVASGCETVDQAEYDRRHAICEGCEHFDAAREKCNLCGCNLKAKIRGAALHCPVGKW